MRRLALPVLTHLSRNWVNASMTFSPVASLTRGIWSICSLARLRPLRAGRPAPASLAVSSPRPPSPTPRAPDRPFAPPRGASESSTVKLSGSMSVGRERPPGIEDGAAGSVGGAEEGVASIEGEDMVAGQVGVRSARVDRGGDERALLCDASC